MPLALNSMNYGFNAIQTYEHGPKLKVELLLFRLLLTLSIQKLCCAHVCSTLLPVMAIIGLSSLVRYLKTFVEPWTSAIK